MIKPDLSFDTQSKVEKVEVIRNINRKRSGLERRLTASMNGKGHSS